MQANTTIIVGRSARPGHLGFPHQAAWLCLLAWVLATCLWSLPAHALQTPDKDWWIAIDQDQVSTVQAMLLRGVDPNARNQKGNPALTQAAREQSWRVFDTLAKAPGIQIDEPNGHDETALMYLCILGQTQRAQSLIDAGAQVNRLGWTPLHYAASKGRLETARMLIRRGAIINAPGPDGTTPLMMAALSGSAATVQLLLKHGADPTMFNLDHESAADWARRGGNGTLATQLDTVSAQYRRGPQHQATGAQDGPSPDAVKNQGAAPTKAPKSATPKAAAPETGPQAAGSFSRYFDLDRFDRPESDAH